MTLRDKIFERYPWLRTCVILGFIVAVCMLFLELSLRIDTNIMQLDAKSDFYTKLKDYSKDFLLSQVSMTFISVSVMSVLSENNIIIYWENVVKERLISPMLLCFSSLTIYAFVIMCFSFLSFYLDLASGVFIFFSLAILDLMVLTSVMIRVYYGRERRKKELEKQYKKMDERDQLINIDILRAYTIQAYENKEYEKLTENSYFLGKYTSIVKMSFLFDRIFDEKIITGYECSVFREIYNGLLDGFDDKYVKYSEMIEKNLSDDGVITAVIKKLKVDDKKLGDNAEEKKRVILEAVGTEVNLLQGSTKKYFEQYIYDSKSNELDNAGTKMFKLLTANYMAKLIDAYCRKWGRENDRQELCKQAIEWLGIDNNHTLDSIFSGELIKKINKEGKYNITLQDLGFKQTEGNISDNSMDRELQELVEENNIAENTNKHASYIGEDIARYISNMDRLGIGKYDKKVFEDTEIGKILNEGGEE